MQENQTIQMANSDHNQKAANMSGKTERGEVTEIEFSIQSDAEKAFVTQMSRKLYCTGY